MKKPNIEQTQALERLSELGKHSSYEPNYNPDILFPIARDTKRKEIGIDPNALPFYGYDSWNHYEVSWLNQKGKPIVATAHIYYDCSSPFIIESKSLKLYFNSFNNTKFSSITSLIETVKNDLQQRLKTDVTVNISPLNSNLNASIESFDGHCLDGLDIECDTYTVEPNYLTSSGAITITEETLYSNLLKSNCLVTKQPDWGSVQIHYKGKQIAREGLLKYIISFRNHNEFHEQCIERIFIDILNHCHPELLTVYGRYTRRGGLDINPYRSTEKAVIDVKGYRLYRQ